MDAEAYLQKQGWVKGQPLQSGGIKHPLMVKHRKDTKGLGYNPLANEGWWERAFDGHLQSLDVTNGATVQFKMDEEKLRKTTSILYTRFRSGGILTGTIETPSTAELDSDNKKRKRAEKEAKKAKKSKSDKKKSKSTSKSKSSSDDSGKKSKGDKKHKDKSEKSHKKHRSK